MWRYYDEEGRSLEPQGPRSPGAPAAPYPNIRAPNWFADQSFVVQYDMSPAAVEQRKIDDAIKTLGLDQGLQRLPVMDDLTDEQQAAYDFLKSKGMLRPEENMEPVTSRFVSNIESDIYAVSSDED